MSQPSNFEDVLYLELPKSMYEVWSIADSLEAMISTSFSQPQTYLIIVQFS